MVLFARRLVNSLFNDIMYEQKIRERQAARQAQKRRKELNNNRRVPIAPCVLLGAF